MKLRAICVFLVLFCLFLTRPVFAEAADHTISVEINGDDLFLSRSDYVLSDGRILLPPEALLQALGAKYSWDERSNTVTVTKDSNKLVLILGQRTVTVNGKTKQIDQPARVSMDNLLVPLRAVSEALGANVSWYSDTRTAMVDTQKRNIGIVEKSMLQAAAQGKVKGVPFVLGTARNTIETSWGKPIEAFYYEGGEFFAYQPCNCAAFYDEQNALSILWLNKESIGNLKTADVRGILGKPKWEDDTQTHSGYDLYYPTGKNSLMFHAPSIHGSIVSLWLSDRHWE